MPTADNPAPLGAARADIPPGIILSRDGLAYIHEDEIDWEVETVEDEDGNEVEVRHRAVALPLYQGKMIWHFDPSWSGWVSGSGSHSKWQDVPWTAKTVQPQFLVLDRRKEGLFAPKLVMRDVSSPTNQRTFVAALVPDFPCGHKVPCLRRGANRVHEFAPLAAVFSSFAFDLQLRQRFAISGGGGSLTLAMMNELGLPTQHSCQWNLLVPLITSLTRGPAFSALMGYITVFQSKNYELAPSALTPHERLRLRCILDAVVAALYGLDLDDLKWILKDCDHPVADVTNKAFARRLDPKGFWRVDKHEPPERRHTVLTLAAFADLAALITAITAAGGTKEEAIAAFCGLGAGAGGSGLGIGDEEAGSAESAPGGAGTAHGAAGMRAGAATIPHGGAGERAATPQADGGTPRTTRGTPRLSRGTLQLLRGLLQPDRGTPQPPRGVPQQGGGTPQLSRGTPQPLRTLGRIDLAEGWMLPETLRLADLGLGHDERAAQPQPVASVLGPRFYDWQLAQDAAESWRECALHARNLLGAEGFEKLQAELEGRAAAEPDKAPGPTSRATQDTKFTLKGGKAPEPNLFGQ
jgi:hypothetical protein